MEFGREICGNLDIASREWLVTNGIGGYASGTVAGLLTRCYHGLLIAALNPPLERTLLAVKAEETVDYAGIKYPLYTNRWHDGTISPHGYLNIERFCLEGTVPVWYFACGDALLTKKICMAQGANTTYIQYTLERASQPLELSIKVLVNYRDHHHNTQGKDWEMSIKQLENGIEVIATPQAIPFYIISDRAQVTQEHNWYYNFDLAVERYRGLKDSEDHLHGATFTIILNPGESLTLVATTEKQPQLNLNLMGGEVALEYRHKYEQELLKISKKQLKKSPNWIKSLVLAADQFIVDRQVPDITNGKTIIAGYHWFSDWGRDTMISLPGLTLSTGRTDIARSILLTFAKYVDEGMLPNCFPDVGEVPGYNTVDATLWYFEAIRAYYRLTKDKKLLKELFPILAEIISCHCQGTRYQIHLDSDGLLYAGEAGVQLTWMDAKVDDWVVTPRIGKPIEVNALWYNALDITAKIAKKLGKSDQEYLRLAEKTRSGFARFWNSEAGYCYDVLDGPDGDDLSLRPNQIFAVSLPVSGLSVSQQKAVVDICGQYLLTSYGLRSLSPQHHQYQGRYGGDRLARDGAYHQGTVWGWLLGHYVQAHLKVYQNRELARSFLLPMANHLQEAGVGNLSEIFDGDAPMTPRGCIAQAWTVAEILRAWVATGS